MVTIINSATLLGLEAKLVNVEIDISPGLFRFNIVGLPDKAVQESRERVISAIRNSGYKVPRKNITINLAPASLLKNGSGFDLAIAVGILSLTKQIPYDANPKDVFWGELSLLGNTRPIDGTLVVVDSLLCIGIQSVILSSINANEAGIVSGIEIIGIETLMELSNGLAGIPRVKHAKHKESHRNIVKPEIDFSQIRGQQAAKRAVEIAAVGCHNLLMKGAPGTGKTMLAKAIPGILPKMDLQERIEVTKIHSVAGKNRAGELIFHRPFRSPHHTSSRVSLVGGGSIPRPGEVSLAHRGILFLDEFNEFEISALESLRQPLEDKEVSIARAAATLVFPADFLLIAAMNPCRCGYLGDEQRECICSQFEIDKYQRKISGPILDRIDIQIYVNRLSSSDLHGDTTEEDSSSIALRIEKARQFKQARVKAIIPSEDIFETFQITANAQKLAIAALEKMNLSTRAYFRVLKVARTIADMDYSEQLKEQHFAEALAFRIQN